MCQSEAPERKFWGREAVDKAAINQEGFLIFLVLFLYRFNTIFLFVFFNFAVGSSLDVLQEDF